MRNYFVNLYFSLLHRFGMSTNAIRVEKFIYIYINALPDGHRLRSLQGFNSRR